MTAPVTLPMHMTMHMSGDLVVDPDKVRAPTQAVWDALSEAERRVAVEALPSEFSWAQPPDGDLHQRTKQQARQALEEFYRSNHRSVYLASEMAVYYPGAPVFAPDLIAVLDVEKHDRMRWVVSDEKRGIDFALEVHVRGDAWKDYERNVERFGRLGIPEYFVYDARRERLAGWRLATPDARSYERIIPQAGRWPSRILQLDLSLETGRLRFLSGNAALLDSREMVGMMSRMVDAAQKRAEQEAQRAEQEAQRAEQEAQRAEQEAQRAEQEAQRATKVAEENAILAAKLRELGVDPDSL